MNNATGKQYSWDFQRAFMADLNRKKVNNKKKEKKKHKPYCQAVFGTDGL